MVSLSLKNLRMEMVVPLRAMGGMHHVDAAAVGQARVEPGALVGEEAADELRHVARGAEQAFLGEGGVGLGELALALDPDVRRDR